MSTKFAPSVGMTCICTSCDKFGGAPQAMVGARGTQRNIQGGAGGREGVTRPTGQCKSHFQGEGEGYRQPLRPPPLYPGLWLTPWCALGYCVCRISYSGVCRGSLLMYVCAPGREIKLINFVQCWNVFVGHVNHAECGQGSCL